MMAPSSMMQPEPMTMGPAMAKMVAFGWTIVPGRREGDGVREDGKGGEWREIPAPTVMSPLSSTSWQTTAFEWIVNLSRLRAAAGSASRARAGGLIGFTSGA